MGKILNIIKQKNKTNRGFGIVLSVISLFLFVAVVIPGLELTKTVITKGPAALADRCQTCKIRKMDDNPHVIDCPVDACNTWREDGVTKGGCDSNSPKICKNNCHYSDGGCGDAFGGWAMSRATRNEPSNFRCAYGEGGGLANYNPTTTTVYDRDGLPHWSWVCKSAKKYSIRISAPKIIDGVCNNAVWNGCSAGTLVDTPDGGCTYNWTCAGINGGNQSVCSKAKPAVNGACGTNTNTCSSGWFQDTTDGTCTNNWNCNNYCNGSNAPCSTAKPAVNGTPGVNGSCGSANGVPAPTKPTANLCSSGNASTVSGTGSWSWTCAGTTGTAGTCGGLPKVPGTGTTATCSAPILPSCKITSNPSKIDDGKSATLSWTSTNATSASATIPANWTTKTTPSGSQSVSPNNTTTYTLQVTGSSGRTATCSTSVGVNHRPNVELISPEDGSTIFEEDTAGLTLKARGTDPDNDPVQVIIQYQLSDDLWDKGTWSPFGLNQIQTYVPQKRPLSIGNYDWCTTARDRSNNEFTSARKCFKLRVIASTPPKPSCSASPASGAAPLSAKATAGLFHGTGAKELKGAVSYAYDFNYKAKNPQMMQPSTLDKTTAYNTYTTSGLYDVYCQIIVNGQAVKADGTLTSLLSDPNAWIRGKDIKVSSAGGGSGGEVAP